MALECSATWAGALQGFTLCCCSEVLVWKLGFRDSGTLWRAANGGVTLICVGAKLSDLCDRKKKALRAEMWGFEALQVGSQPHRVTLLGSRGI